MGLLCALCLQPLSLGFQPAEEQHHEERCSAASRAVACVPSAQVDVRRRRSNFLLLVDFIAFGLAPQSLLTPLGAMVLVYNMIIASFYGEKWARRDDRDGRYFIGTLLCIVFADHYTPSYSFSDILALWYTSRMLWYIILVPLFCSYARCSSAGFSRTVCTSTRCQAAHVRLLCFCLAGAAGIIGAQAILFAKQTMELLKAWGLGEPIWAHYEVYLIVIGIPVGLVGQPVLPKQALAMFDALPSCPNLSDVLDDCGHTWWLCLL